jgi:hypothetical protein
MDDDLALDEVQRTELLALLALGINEDEKARVEFLLGARRSINTVGGMSVSNLLTLFSQIGYLAAIGDTRWSRRQFRS